MKLLLIISAMFIHFKSIASLDQKPISQIIEAMTKCSSADCLLENKLLKNNISKKNYSVLVDSAKKIKHKKFQIKKQNFNSFLIVDSYSRNSLVFEIPFPLKRYLKINNRIAELKPNMILLEMIEVIRNLSPKFSLNHDFWSLITPAAFAADREDIPWDDPAIGLYFMGATAYLFSNASNCIDAIEVAHRACRSLPMGSINVSESTKDEIFAGLPGSPQMVDTWSCAGMTIRDMSFIPGGTNIFREQEKLSYCVEKWRNSLSDDQKKEASDFRFVSASIFVQNQMEEAMDKTLGEDEQPAAK